MIKYKGLFKEIKKDFKKRKKIFINEMTKDAIENIENLTPVKTSYLKNNYKDKKVNDSKTKIKNDTPYGYIVNHFTAKQKPKYFLENGLKNTEKNLDKLFSKYF